MRHLVLCASVLAIAGCGASEDQIRAEERAKILEERVAELEADKGNEKETDAEKTDATTFDTPETESVAVPRSSEVRDASPSGSERLIASYNAFIGSSDLYNSSGKRLTKPWQVLRQDRANFPRFNVSQRGDQSDPFFRSAKNRAVMERMVGNGTIESGAARRIVDGNVQVRVEIYGTGSFGQRVQVSVR